MAQEKTSAAERGFALLARLGGWSGERAVAELRGAEPRAAAASKYQDRSPCAGGSCQEPVSRALYWDRGAPAGGSQDWGAPARSHSAAAASKYQDRRQSAGGSCQEADSAALHWDRVASASGSWDRGAPARTRSLCLCPLVAIVVGYCFATVIIVLGHQRARVD